MPENDNAIVLKKELEEILPRKLAQVFRDYGLDLDELLVPLKWKPLVLFIGNYSSGKSTFINEFLGRDIQRTGQAPTDDSFTIITAPEGEEPEGDLTGSTVVNDERFPFESLRGFGQKLLSHLSMKRVKAPVLENIAIIDTPGMLDSVTEKDRGYDYLGVIGELAKLADLIVLMFDPHKAGTIKETYKVLRVTLPGMVGEDRVRFVLNRIDECESLEDLVRAYGTLCWNLSQMTGRKDIPRIFLTYARIEGREVLPEFKIWEKEREELKRSLLDAPRMRLYHMLQEVDNVVRELALEIEALENLKSRFRTKLWGFSKSLIFAGTGAFFLGDLAMNLIFGYPSNPFVMDLVSGTLGPHSFLWPLIWLLLVVAAGSAVFQKITFPRFARGYAADPDPLVKLKTPYERDLWPVVRQRVSELIEKHARRQVWMPHSRNLQKVRRFLKKDLQAFYERIKLY